MKSMNHNAKAWLRRVADSLEDWPPKDLRGASRAVMTPIGAAMLIIQRRIPDHLRQAVTLALPVMETSDFDEAAALVRLTARQLPD